MRSIISAVVCLLIAAGGAAMVTATIALSDDQAQAVAEDDSAKPVNVRVEVLQGQSIDDELILTGRLVAWEEATISAETSGRIERQAIEEGAQVAQGQELFRVETTTIQSTHDQAEARLELAVQELERARNLKSRGVGTQEALDRALTEQNLAQADLDAVQLTLEKSIVRAPFAGRVDTLMKKQGEFVDTGAPLVRLIQVEPIKAMVPVPESDIRFFKVDDTVALTVEAHPGRTFEGKVFRIAISADPLTRTFAVEASIPNPDALLKPGMTVRATLVRQQFENAITVPLFSVVSLENQRFVAVEDSGVAKIRPVQVGRIRGDRVHVTSGLVPGDHLIVSGQRDLRDGQPVAVLQDNAPT